MAIFGNLNQMPLAELFPVLSARRGALELFGLEQLPTVTLYFEASKLRCVKVGSVWADALRARSIVAHLVQSRRGSFEYLPDAEPRGCKEELWIPLDRLLLATATMQDEVENARPSLPHPDTKFAIKKHDPPEDPELLEFWQRSVPLLARGASASELSRKLGVRLEPTRLYLLKLRLAGRIQLHVEQAGAQKRVRGRSGLAAKLLTALRSRLKRGGA